MISFRTDIARKNDELMAYDKIDNLFLFTHPSSKERERTRRSVMDKDIYCVIMKENLLTMAQSSSVLLE